MTKCLDPKKIKSAQRALEVLEYFSLDRPTATVMDIARSMGYPQSSTSELLNCLVTLGYLDRERDARTYRPTARVAVLGASVQPDLFRAGRLLPILDHLAAEAGVTATLAHKVGVTVQYIQIIRHPGATAQLSETDGLARSAAGKMILTTMDPLLVRKLVHRINAEIDDERICAVALADAVRAASIQGFAFHSDGYRGSLAMLVPQARDARPLALTIHGSAETFEAQRDWLLQMTRGAIARIANPNLAASELPTPEPLLRYG